MKKRNVIGLIAFVAMSGLAIMGARGGCGSDLHKAAIAADSIGSSLSTASSINHQLIANDQISAADGSEFAATIDQTAKANDAFVAQLKQAEANGGAVNTASIVSDFRTLATRIKNLQQQGVLHIKDATSVQKFNDVMAAINAQIAILKGILGTGSARLRVPGNSGPPLLAALALSGSEIEELLGLIIPLVGDGATLVQKLVGMKGESDSTLLTDAGAQDAAAEKQAEADEKPAT